MRGGNSSAHWLDNDRERAETALSWIQDLYATERKARDEELSPDHTKEPGEPPWFILCWERAPQGCLWHKLHGVNPTQWLTHVLANILQTKYNDVRALFPQNFSQS